MNAVSCPRCGAAITPGMRFCGQCGGRLADASEGERRQLTVLFSDLISSTEMSTRLDPEDLRDVLGAYHRLAASGVERYDGYIAQYLGDGVLAYFGYPRAHEDDAERAVMAGLEILGGLESLNRELETRYQERIALRVGLHTGQGVVAAGEGGDEVRMVGETPNVAARVQHEAPSNGLAISEATDRLLPSRIQRHSLGTFTLKGLRQPVRLFQVTGIGRATRPDLDGGSALVDRRVEVAMLSATWNAFATGAARPILLRGEPGIGKSRLLAVIRGWAEDSDVAWLECQCAAVNSTSAFHPLIQLVPHLNERAVVAVEFLAGVQGLQVGSVAPAKRRQQAIQQLTGDLIESARGHRTALVIEDLHWSDASTTELLHGLLRQSVPGLLCVLTCRSGYEPPFLELLEVLDVERLAEKDTRELLSLITGPLDETLNARLLLGSEGVPLFAVELARTWQDAKLAGVADATVPMTLHDALMARLDRIPSARTTAQLASVLGREFPLSLLVAVHTTGRDSVAADVKTLVGSGVLVPAPDNGDEGYRFSHVLLRDVAYQSLLRKTRQTYHARAARVMLEQFPGSAELAPEVVALHFAQANEPSPAIAQWQRAARRALLRSANREAVSHLSSALTLLESTPEDDDRNRLEMQLQVGIGGALVGLEGYGSPNAGGHYERARQLGEGSAPTPELGPVWFGLLAFYGARGGLRTMLGLAEEMHEIAVDGASLELLLEANFALGMAHFYRGQLREAERALAEGMSLYRPDEHRHLAATYVFDPGVGCRRSLALTLWLRGDVELAGQRAREAVELAKIVAHPYSLASALVFQAILCQLAGRPDECLTVATAALDLSVENGFGFWQAWAAILRGWAHGGGQALSEMETTLAGYRASGARLMLPYFLGLVAERKLDAQLAPEAAALLSEALDLARRDGERWYVPELHRLTFAASGSRLEMARARRAAKAMGALTLQRRYANG